MNFRFTKEDGTGAIDFAEPTEFPGTDIRFTVDEITPETVVRDRRGRVGYVRKHKTLKVFRFIFTLVSRTIFENIKTVRAYRRMLFFPDSSNTTNEFRIRIPQVQPENIYEADGKVSTEFIAQEF